MAFKYSLSAPVHTSGVLPPQDILDAVGELYDHLVGFSNICSENEQLWICYDNCCKALDLLAKDPSALEVLDLDNSISSVLNLQNPTVDQAVAGLEGLVKDIWEKIKGFFKKIWNWIKGFFAGTSKKVEDDTSKSKALKDSVKNVEPEELKKLLDEPMPGLLSKKCVFEMYKNAGHMSGSKGPIAGYIENMTDTVTAAEKYIKELEQGTGKDSFDDMLGDIWGTITAANGAGSDLLKPFGMQYTFSFDNGVQLSKVDEGFLEKCDTLRAGGWTSAAEYADQCAVVCNTTYNLYKDWLRSQSTIQSDLDKCSKLADKLQQLTAKNLNFRASNLRTQLTIVAKGLGIIASRLKQINGACYCAALDARVQKILNRTVQKQYKIED